MWSIITLGNNCGAPDMNFSECFASVEKEGKLECGIFKRKFHPQFPLMQIESGTQLYLVFLLRVFLVLLLRLTVFLGQGVSPLQSSVGQPLCELLRIKVTCNKSIW